MRPQSDQSPVRLRGAEARAVGAQVRRRGPGLGSSAEVHALEGEAALNEASTYATKVADDLAQGNCHTALLHLTVMVSATGGARAHYAARSREPSTPVAANALRRIHSLDIVASQSRAAITRCARAPRRSRPTLPPAHKAPTTTCAFSHGARRTRCARATAPRCAMLYPSRTSRPDVRGPLRLRGASTRSTARSGSAARTSTLHQQRGAGSAGYSKSRGRRRGAESVADDAGSIGAPRRRARRRGGRRLTVATARNRR